MRNRAVLVALAALLLALVSACGGTGGGNHNDADVRFARQMIPHHRQAIMMSRLARSNEAGPEVAALATRIAAAQAPEIDEMAGWLDDWNERSGHMDPDDMGGMGGGSTGMMSAGDMQALAASRGAAFDRLYLTQMIEHHQGAIDMAQREQSEGKNPDAIALAKRIEKSQTAEIAEMEKLLG